MCVLSRRSWNLFKYAGAGREELQHNKLRSARAWETVQLSEQTLNEGKQQKAAVKWG